MRQCTLTKDNIVQVAWIDVSPSDKGRFTSIKQSDGTYDPDWQIVEVGGLDLDKSWISARSKDHKNMRKMTDV